MYCIASKKEPKKLYIMAVFLLVPIFLSLIASEQLLKEDHWINITSG